MRVFNVAKCPPRPEPAEDELREIIEHVGADTAAPQHPADKGAAAE
jgi:hypothetical protein